MNNPYRVIKRLAFVTGFCIVSCTTALAQQSSLFIFLQSDNLQPFYVQIGDKVYSSSAVGHLIISGLPDNTCNFEVGFPQQTARPAQFSIPLRSKDHGYQLVKSGSRDWALFDWQTQETIKPLKEPGNSSALLYGERKKDDAFATLMAAVVNDSSVLYTSIVKKDAETVPEVAAKTETKVNDNKPVAKTEDKPPVPQVPVDTARIEKKAESIAVTTPPVSITAKVVKNEPVRDTTIAGDVTAVQPAAPVTKDTALVTKYDPKETPLSNKKPVKANVVKIQQQTKDGETKLVYVDSSESPVDVVTVYVADKKPVVQAQAPVQTPPQPVENNVPTEAVKKETTAKKDTAKSEVAVIQAKPDVVETTRKDDKPVAPPVTLTKEEIADKIKQETWKQVPEKKSTTDTITIILESRQMKKDTPGKSSQDAPTLYQPKQVGQQEPVKPPVVDTPVVQLAAPPKQDVATITKPQTDKQVTNDKAATQPEAAKPVTDLAPKTAMQTASVKKVKDAEADKPQPPKAVYAAAADSAKKAESEAPAKKDTAAVAKKEHEKKSTNNTLVMINSDCIRFATDNDVDKLRVKMLAENDWQKRVGIANKSFKTMCLYAKQIKALSELFTTDETKYKFLEMAYPFAADTANFKQLYELFADAGYQTKFKTLVRLQ